MRLISIRVPLVRLSDLTAPRRQPNLTPSSSTAQTMDPSELLTAFRHTIVRHTSYRVASPFAFAACKAHAIRRCIGDACQRVGAKGRPSSSRKMSAVALAARTSSCESDLITVAQPHAASPVRSGPFPSRGLVRCFRFGRCDRFVPPVIKCSLRDR